jgi:hypothetical protein
MMTTMTEAEAEMFGISPEDRFSYVRLDDVKRNMAPAAKASWFELCSVSLGNTHDPLYPNGDSVGVIVPWQQPDDELKAAPNSELNTALDVIREGPNPGAFFRASKQGGGKGWVGNVLCEMFRTSEKEAKSMIGQWLKSGLLYEEEYYHPVWKRRVSGVRVNDSLRPS